MIGDADAAPAGIAAMANTGNMDDKPFSPFLSGGGH